MKTLVQQLQSRIDRRSFIIAIWETFPKGIPKAEWKRLRAFQTLDKRLMGELIALTNHNKYLTKAYIAACKERK